MEALLSCVCSSSLALKPAWLVLFLPLSCSGKFFRARFPSPLAGGAKLKLSLETVYTHVLLPYPTHISQAEKQFVVFEGNHYFYSPYPTRAQSTRVRLASKNVESYSKLGSPSKSDEVIEYGPFKDIAPYSQVITTQGLKALREVVT